ncbi:MAG: ABC transporter substrate-binding protein [Actinomycetota bacterium]|nr:ABC transporter substrate-binding protein [Actinomycetota bacterium]
MRKFTIILIIILAALWLAASCRYEDLGLGSALAEETESQNQGDRSEINNEEFFFQLKNKQKIQNPLADINIRRAILYAIDRQEIVRELMGDYNAVLNSLFSEKSPYYHTAWEMYDYDLEAARESLAKAGYSEDKPLYLTLGIGMKSGARQKIAEMIERGPAADRNICLGYQSVF